MSDDQSPGADPRPPRWAYPVAVAWAVFSGFTLAVVGRYNPDARLFVAAAPLIGVVAPLAGAVATRRTGDLRYIGSGLVIGAFATPSGFAEVLNLIPLISGVVLLVSFYRNRRRSSQLGS